MAVETNIRIVQPGRGLYLAVRKARVEGTLVNSELLQKACARLQIAHGLAAVPLPGPEPALAVATVEAVPEIHLKDAAWELAAGDAGDLPRLTMNDAGDAARMAALLERGLHIQMARRARRWSYDSPRHWYELEYLPQSDDTVAAYERIAFTGVVVEGVGIGVAADVQLAFFTKSNLAWFFDDTLCSNERQRRRQLFARLAQRTQGQGTLVYHNGRVHVKCYFAEAPPGLTCGTTGQIRVQGQTYPSLLEYYLATNPKMMVEAHTPAIRVSFEGLDGPQPVAANRVRLRVFNEVLPSRLQRLPVMEPGARRHGVERFWREVGPKPFGRMAPGLQPHFWRPDASRTFVVPGPALLFSRGRTLKAAAPGSHPDVAKQYYNCRLDMLRDGGCWRLPPTVSRTLDYAFAAAGGEEAPRQLAADVCARLKDWTGKTFSPNKIPYSDVADSVEKLRHARDEGAILYVLNGEPSAYHEVALQLSERRIKRLTEEVLHEKYRGLREGLPERRTDKLSYRLGRQEWDSFVTLNALEILDQLDGAPFITDCGPYEAQLVIDVGRDRRYFALSILINRLTKNGQHQFEIQTEVYNKSDSKFETINGTVLETEIIRLLKRVLAPSRRPGGGCSALVPLASLSIFRDGRLDRDEPKTLEKLPERLSALGLLTEDARVDIGLVFKDTLKQFRVWDVDANDNVQNVAEGTAVEISGTMMLLANTGRTTLRRGTAEPLVLCLPKRNSGCLRDLTVDAHTGSQTNWSSPRVAQRLFTTLRRTDEQLIARAQQETRRIR